MSDDTFEKTAFGRILAPVIVIHILFDITILVAIIWVDSMTICSALGVIGWLILSDISGIFACMFAAVCFLGPSDIKVPAIRIGVKVIAYPVGAIIVLSMLVGLSFPFGILGVMLGVIAGGI